MSLCAALMDYTSSTMSGRHILLVIQLFEYFNVFHPGNEDKGTLATHANMSLFARGHAICETHSTTNIYRNAETTVKYKHTIKITNANICGSCINYGERERALCVVAGGTCRRVWWKYIWVAVGLELNSSRTFSRTHFWRYERARRCVGVVDMMVNPN